MGCSARQQSLRALLIIALVLGAGVAQGAPRSKSALARKTGPTLESVRSEMNTLEKDLLATRETHANAAGQLKKIRRLLALQQKEISLSRKKITDLDASWQELGKQKDALSQNIEHEKAALKTKLRELNRLADGEALDAHWLGSIETQNQKAYYLSKTLKKDMESVARLRQDAVQAQNLELRILEEKNKLDYYVQELQSQVSFLSANESVQKEILGTNRANRLEALARMRAVREKEQAIEQVLPHKEKEFVREMPVVSSVKKEPAPLVPPASRSLVEFSLAALKGKLPFPATGNVLSAFGKSYNSKTNLLTFQKGITLGTSSTSDVKAVAGGKVVFAGPLKNYGLIAIVEHPGQYYTLYGQMGSVAVAEGMSLQQGDVLGKTASEPLYFEIRNKNVAINPLQWLNTSSITLSKNTN